MTPIEIDKQYTILAVDDAKDTLILLEFDLTSEGYQVKTVTSGEQALSLIASDSNLNEGDFSTENHTNIDLILLDLYMPSMSGLATLKAIKSDANTRDLPVIMLSASNDEDEIVEALELGADDYVTKPYIAKVLLARIKTSLRLMTKTKELEVLAKTDFLTNINNRASFYDLSLKAISQCKRSRQNLVIVMFDIDFFKLVNDDFGHDVGDKVLVEFAQILSYSFRDYDVVARIGGEEFAVCMPNTSMDDAIIVCDRFRVKVENYQIDIEHSSQKSISITVSAGVASRLLDNSDEQLSVDDLLKSADQMLYHAKNNGRNTVFSTNSLEEDIPVLSGSNLDSNVTTDSTTGISSGIINNMSCRDDLDNVCSTSDDKFPGIDFSVGMANVLDDEPLFKEILVLFYQDHCHDGDKLKNAFITADIKAAKHVAHTLKGVACSVGAMTLFERTKELDYSINVSDFEEFETLFEQGVLPELLKVLAGIKQQLNDQL